MGVLDGKTALVTGGSRGIGRAIVQRLADDGASVMFSFVQNKSAADDVAASVNRSGGRTFAIQADHRFVRRTALRRLGQPADIANVVAFLSGPDSQWITGQNLRVTGGLL